MQSAVYKAYSLPVRLSLSHMKRLPSSGSFMVEYCRSGEEQSHKSPTPCGAVVLMSTVGLSSLFSFILITRLAYDVSTNLELAS